MTGNVRRRVLTLLAASTAGMAFAQSKLPRMPRVGYLTHGPSDAWRWLFDAIEVRLRELGWVEGRQVLKELVPRAMSVVALANPENPSTPAFVKDAEAGARSLGMRLEIVARRDPSEIDRKLRAMAPRPDMLVVQNDAYFHSEMQRLLALVAVHRLPAVYGAREWPDAGGLVSYGSNLRTTYAQLADYLDRILRGAKPGDLPVTEPTRLELVINEASAKSLGLVVTPSLTLGTQK